MSDDIKLDLYQSTLQRKQWTEKWINLAEKFWPIKDWESVRKDRKKGFRQERHSETCTHIKQKAKAEEEKEGEEEKKIPTASRTMEDAP